MPKPIIKIENLSFAYHKKINILEDINLNIFQNDFLGIIGPNGGGKTTLLKIILGLLDSDKGTITVFDKTPKIARNMIGYVPQFLKTDLNCPISVLEIVLAGILSSKKIFQQPFFVPADIK